eukprot:scaffold6288_cov131-Skeletonema_dohrnii-CCMP3373.AAC.3
MSTKKCRLAAVVAPKEGKEDDIGALIYRESQLRKKEAAAAKTSKKNSSASKHRGASTHKDTAAAIRGDSSFATPESRQAAVKSKRHLPTDVDEGKEAARKVARKRHRYECSADGCTNYVVKGGVCIRHGAKRKQCSSAGCSNQAIIGGLCKKHGGERKPCSIDRCTNHVVRGGVCIRHGAKVKLCIHEGCTTYARQGGVCKRHGAKVKLCSYEGCTNQAKQKGVCRKHGAYRNPHDESTAFGLSCRSAYDETTATLPHQHTVAVSTTNKERSRELPQEAIRGKGLLEREVPTVGFQYSSLLFSAWSHLNYPTPTPRIFVPPPFED